MPFATIREGRSSRKRWLARDRMLAVALTQYESSVCPSCGHPRDRSLNEDMEGWYVTHRAKCLGCLSVSHHLEEHGKLQPGEYTFVVDESPDGHEPDPKMMPKI